MTDEREVKKETDFWGNEKEVIYEDGRKVGEYRLEERGGFMGMGTRTEKVEYNSDGDEVGYSRQEERGGFMGMGTENKDVHYNTDDEEIGHSQVEERGGFMGMGTHHVSVEYDHDGNEVSQSNWERRGTLLGMGGERVRVTRSADGSASLGGSGGSRNSARGGATHYGASSATDPVNKGSRFRLVLIGFLGIFLVLAVISALEDEGQPAPSSMQSDVPISETVEPSFVPQIATPEPQVATVEPKVWTSTFVRRDYIDSEEGVLSTGKYIYSSTSFRPNKLGMVSVYFIGEFRSITDAPKNVKIAIPNLSDNVNNNDLSCKFNFIKSESSNFGRIVVLCPINLTIDPGSYPTFIYFDDKIVDRRTLTIIKPMIYLDEDEFPLDPTDEYCSPSEMGVLKCL